MLLAAFFKACNIHVHTSIIPYSQQLKWEATQGSTDGWMVKQNVVHPYNAILLSVKKEFDTCYSR
jgi:hypothetical protein